MPRTLLAIFALVLALAARAAEDVPFVVTPDNVTLAMLRMARVTDRDYVIDLGSGDGRIVIVAARQFGARGLGVEIVPDLVAKSRENAARAGVSSRAEFREQDLFKTDLAPATVITMYLLPDVNMELRPRLLALKPGTRVVSHDWDMGDWIPDATQKLDVPDKPIGFEKSSKVHLWIVPARVHGAWCVTGLKGGATLELDQKFQQVRAKLTRGTSVHTFDARIDGTTMRSVDNSMILDVKGETLRTRAVKGQFGVLKNAQFVRRAVEKCT